MTVLVESEGEGGVSSSDTLLTFIVFTKCSVS